MRHDRIKECRLRASLSQAQLGTRLGVSRQAVTKWESGRVAVPRDGSSSVSRRTGTDARRSPAEQLCRGPPCGAGQGRTTALSAPGVRAAVRAASTSSRPWTLVTSESRSTAPEAAMATAVGHVPA